MKPKIRFVRLQTTSYWLCEGIHPKHPGITSTFAATPIKAFEDWLSFWDIPF